MGEATKIQWADHTFSPWRVDGDRRIVAGENKWDAVKLWESFPSDELQYRPRVLVGVDVFEKWEGKLTAPGGGPNWYLADNGVSPATLHHVRDRLFYLIDVTPNLDWLVFTRTPENIKQMTPLIGRDVIPDDECGIPVKCPWDRPNLWLGTDIDDQATADEHIPHLLKVPAKVRMARYSGVGRVDLRRISVGHDAPKYDCLRGRLEFTGQRGEIIHLLIISGEVGPGARPCNLEHVRDAIRQAKAAGVPVWVERLGSRPVQPRKIVLKVGERIGDLVPVCNAKNGRKLRDLHGADPAEWSEDLRVREVPACN